ncbi:MAG: glycosyltransferase [Acetobacteraceae bacterium]
MAGAATDAAGGPSAPAGQPAPEGGEAPRPVLHLLAGGRHGGAETFATDLICGLAETAPQAVIARPAPERVARLRAAGVTVIEDSLAYALPAPLGRLLVARHVARLRPRAVVAYMGRAAAVAPRGAIGWFGGYYDLKRYRRCRRLVAITPDMQADMARRGADPSLIHLIPTFARLDDGEAAERAALSTPEDAKVVLCLARLHPKKGLDTLLDALAAVPGAVLWLAGEGELRGALEAEARRLGIADRVRFLGWREDKGALLRAADVLVVPSRYEPFGTVVIEGWQAGVPVVAARAAGPAATIRDGETGLLVPVDDAPALAAALRRVLEDRMLALSLALAAKEEEAERFSRAAVLAAWRALIEKVAEEERR